MGYIHRTYNGSTDNYVNLNYIPQSSTKVEIKFKTGTHFRSNDNLILGIFQNYNGRDAFALNAHNQRHNFSYYVGGTFNDYAGSFSENTEYEVALSTTAFTLNGTTTIFSSSYNPGSTNKLLIGSASNNGGSIDGLLEWDMYYFRVYEGDTLVYNLIPFKNNDGYGCLKNTLTNTIYNFTNPSDIEYISTFDPSKSTFNFSSTGGTEQFTLEAETGWTATTSYDWVSLNSMTGTTGGTLTLTCNRNTGNARVATITFTNADGDTFNITINQKKMGIIVPIGKMKKSGYNINKEYYHAPIPVMPQNEIWYITNDDDTIDVYSESRNEDIDGNELSVTSNTYTGKGIMKFDGDIYKLSANGNGAFYGKGSLKEIYLPDGINYVGGQTFYSCVNLETIHFGSGVEEIIGNLYVVGGCMNLKYIYITASVPPDTSRSNWLDNTKIPTEGAIYVPSESIDAYKAAFGWSNYADRIQALPE